MPSEMRGLLPRIRSVGVGSTYENSLFRELKGERPIFRVQLCGELYLTEGLDEELNLDRSGFLEVAAEYQTLMSAVNGFVRSLIQDLDKVQGTRRKRRARQKRQSEESEANAAIAEGLRTAGLDFTIHRMVRAALRLQKQIDYLNRSAYPASDPVVVIDHQSRAFNVPFESVDPTVVMVLAAVDRALGEFADRQVLRRAVAQALNGIVR